MKVEEQIAIIYCGVNGMLNAVPVSKIKDCESEFIKLMHKEYADTLIELREGKLTDGAKRNIEQAISDIIKNYS